jgi:hypothetical protein
MASPTVASFTDAELREMARDALFAFVDVFPDAAALAWAPLDERCEAEKLAALAEVQRVHGTGVQAAIEITTRVAQIVQARDAAMLKGMTAVAGALIGLLAPGGREAARQLLKGLPGIP